MRLRRRLNTVLLQWFLLFVIVAGAAWFFTFPAIQHALADDRLLLASTIAKSLDASLSGTVQNLGRLSADLNIADAQTPARLHGFRLQSDFGNATYLLDAAGTVIASDPFGAPAVPPSALGVHESVTPLIQKPAGAHPVLAIVQPFKRERAQYFLISEMNPHASSMNAFIKDLKADRPMQIAVVDENGIAVASDDPDLLLRTLPTTGLLVERIRSHRPIVTEDEPNWRTGDAAASVTVMAPLQFAPWGVAIQEPADKAYAGLHTTGRGLLLTGLGLAAMGALVARTLSRSVVAPIDRLSKRAAAMRAGDLASPIAISGDHELEVLAGTLDDARARLAATLDELKAFNVRLEEQVAARTRVIVQQDEQRKTLVRRLLGATEDERRRLARELHDEIAQLLTVIQISLDQANVDTPEMRKAGELLVRTQQEIHRIIYDLRPSLLDDLGLAAAMRSYASDHLNVPGLRVNLEIEEPLPARPEIETVIFRIYQELVTNVLRHAEAEQVSIELAKRGGSLLLTVEDDGKGFDPEARSEGAGLTGMRERAALVNGTIRFDSAPGVGTQVTVEIPLQ